MMRLKSAFFLGAPMLFLGCEATDLCERHPWICEGDDDDDDEGGGDEGSQETEGTASSEDGGDSGEPSFCGGIAGFPCPDGQVCIDDPTDNCDPAMGGADCAGVCVEEPGCSSDGDCKKGAFCQTAPGVCGEGLGSCETRPEACILIYDPVCGCDGVTYGNACQAASAGVNVASEGACESGSTCDAVIDGFMDETSNIRLCMVAEECGQVLSGTSCGCTRNWVARLDADIGPWSELLDRATALGCEIPGGISTCDCPPADGFACIDNVCHWNYTD